MHTHFLQSQHWHAFQKALGRTVYVREGNGWQYRAILEPGTKLSPTRLYCPYGPTVTSERSLQTALASLDALARSVNAVFVRVEPLGASFDAKRLGLQEVDYSQPSYTWQIDLTQPKAEILAAMKQSTRNICKNYQKKALSYRQSTNPDDIALLLPFLHEVAHNNTITIHSDAYLTTQAKILLPAGAGLLHFIEQDGSPIAAALTFEDETTSYYAHAGASYTHRRLGASTALVGEIILNAKKRGKTVCDLYGVTPSTDPTHRWAGFTRFKQSFGGSIVKLSPTYDLPIHRMRYAGYIASRSTLKKARTVTKRLRLRKK